jgi:hypothetical protein
LSEALTTTLKAPARHLHPAPHLRVIK